MDSATNKMSLYSIELQLDFKDQFAIICYGFRFCCVSQLLLLLTAKCQQKHAVLSPNAKVTRYEIIIVSKFKRFVSILCLNNPYVQRDWNLQAQHNNNNIIYCAKHANSTSLNMLIVYKIQYYVVQLKQSPNYIYAQGFYLQNAYILSGWSQIKIQQEKNTVCKYNYQREFV